MSSVVRGPKILKLSSRVLQSFFIQQRCNNTSYISPVYNTLSSHFHTCNVLSKKRKTEEEKKTEREGRRVLKFSPKAKIMHGIVDIWRNMSVKDVAKVLGKDTDHVFETMEFINDSENYNKENSIIDNPEVIKSIVRISGYKFRIVPRPEEVESKECEDKDAVRNQPAPIENLKPRPPVVTVMGHVDHGKTTLLDTLRSTHVVDREFGGITQHIGAFSVELESGELVTFLDTPGHAAFTAMRSRGAHVTDMVVLVVAADDGVMEQTVESIRMAKEANVPIIVAINKIDKPVADIERTKQMLAQQGVLVEDLGGDVQAIPVSALKGTNLDVLVEAISLQAQLMDLKADPTGPVEGVVIEAQTDAKRGKLATIIVQRGTLRRGTIVVSGEGWARARVMFSSDGTPVSEAPPSTSVQLLGWRALPFPGDDIIEVESEKRAGEVMKWRLNKKMHEKQVTDSKVIADKVAEHDSQYKVALERKRSMGRYKIRPDGPRKKMFTESNDPRLNIVIKGDVDGSVEAILDVLETYDDHARCKLDIVHYGLGNVSETDVELAEAFDAILYAFNVECPAKLSSFVKEKMVTLRHHNVIYKMIDNIKEEINARIPTSKEEEIIGEANVLQNFTVNEGRKKTFVAGCRCVRGVLKKNALYRVVRGLDTVFEGKLHTMKHLKNEVDTIKKDIECGLRLSEDEFEPKPGDRVICYHLIDVSHKTDWDPGF